MIRIRKAHPLDASCMLDLMRAYHKEMPAEVAGIFDDKITAERILAHTGAPDNFQCLAFDGSQPVGVLAACLAPMRYWSSELMALDVVLYVLPKYRAKGAGLKLIREYEKWAKSNGCRHISLSCSSRITEDRTYQLYERLGYESIGAQFIKEI